MSALPCGTDTDDIVEQVAAGQDAPAGHEQTCPHCRAAREEYQRLWAPVDALAREVVHAPDAVIDRALARVRAVADRPAVGRIDTEDRLGSTWLATRVVVTCARIAAEEVDGVCVALGRFADEADPRRPGEERDADGVRIDVGLSGGTAVVALSLAASWGHDLPALGQEVRRLVGDRVRAATGLRTVTVDVHVDALVGPDES